MKGNDMKNAVIKSASIEIESHGILTLWLQLDYGGEGQGFGGYNLEGASLANHIRGIMDVLEVTRWADVVGKPCRVRNEMVSDAGDLGHFVKDKWFNPAQYPITNPGK
jgi:hypothetical protein